MIYGEQKKMVFKISVELVEQIDEAVARWGFSTRAEFFRHAAIEFLRNDAQAVPTDEVFKENTKAMNRIHLYRPRPRQHY
jgi:metal-responsive CopG/Arc/MetJ family transcriptional regulator